MVKKSDKSTMSETLVSKTLTLIVASLHRKSINRERLVEKTLTNRLYNYHSIYQTFPLPKFCIIYSMYMYTFCIKLFFAKGGKFENQKKLD